MIDRPPIIVQKRRLAAEWLAAAMHEDFEPPDDPDLHESVEEELTRQWQQVWCEFQRRVGR